MRHTKLILIKKRTDEMIYSNWFLEHDNAFTVLRCPPLLPEFNPI